MSMTPSGEATALLTRPKPSNAMLDAATEASLTVAETSTWAPPTPPACCSMIIGSSVSDGDTAHLPAGVRRLTTQDGASDDSAQLLSISFELLSDTSEKRTVVLRRNASLRAR